MNRFFVDLHIHLGRDGAGNPVKISASRDLTVAGVIEECALRKGVDVAGVVDCHSPGVLADLRRLVESGGAEELPGGGVRARIEGPARRHTEVVLVAASEVEVVVNGGPCHLVVYLPTLDSMERFSSWLGPLVRNIRLSSQRCDAAAADVVEQA
ncbi:MAG: endonuclease Q family protein, partial [Firmicutes bacterium]|nr:endonuclease Q family protein [Bacillota bacterium]